MKQKRKIIIMLCLCISIIGLTGCDKEEPLNSLFEHKINVIDKSKESTIEGIELVKIADTLYYDSNTYIVFIWNGSLGTTNCDTIPTPYPAPNGLPYKYNPDTNTLEEIKE